MFWLLLQRNYPNSKSQTNSIRYSWKRIAECFCKIRRKGNQEDSFDDFWAFDGRSEARIPPGLPLGATSKPTVSDRVGARDKIELQKGEAPDATTICYIMLHSLELISRCLHACFGYYCNQPYPNSKSQTNSI